jgi:hypothetical protein
MIKRKAVITISIIVVIFLGIVSYSLAATGVLNVQDDTLKIVNNQIVYKNNVLTVSPEIKQFPSLSPNLGKIAFVDKMNLSNPIWGIIQIIDLKSGEISSIPLAENYANAFENVEWVDDNTVAITGHVNPSLCTYEIYDINKAVRKNIYYGIGFMWNKAKSRLYYTIPAPHFANVDKGKNTIVNQDGDVLYQSSSNVMILSGSSLSNDDSKIAFFEDDLTSGALNLVIGDKKDDKNICIQKRLKWENSLGKISWDDMNVIRVKSRYKDISFDTLNDKTIKVEDITKGIEKNPYINNK